MRHSIHDGTGHGAQGGWHTTRGRGRHGRPRRKGRYALMGKSRRADRYPSYTNGQRDDGSPVTA